MIIQEIIIVYNNIFICRLIACLFFLLTLCFPSSLVFADEITDPGQITFRQQISDLGFEHIDPYTGHLTLIHRDVSLPGNGGLDLEINRVYKYSRPTFNYSPFGYHWDLHFGRLKKIGSSVAIELSDGTENNAYKENYGSQEYIYLTKDFWKVNMEGTPTLQLPDGTEIIFGRGGNTYYDKWYYATEIRKNNSTITIHYGTNRRIDYVMDSVGRRIDFHYSSASANNLSSITYGQRTLASYYYPGTGDFPYWLSRVVYPDGETWQYQYDHFHISTLFTHNGLSSIVTPYGGTITYDYDRFIRGYIALGYIAQISIKQKTVAGPGLAPGTWSYDYGIKK